MMYPSGALPLFLLITAPVWITAAVVWVVWACEGFPRFGGGEGRDG